MAGLLLSQVKDFDCNRIAMVEMLAPVVEKRISWVGVI
jgi:hypothetical protein